MLLLTDFHVNITIMKILIFNLFFSVFIFVGSNAFAKCVDLCNDAWWNKINSNELTEYTKNIKSINIKDDYGFTPLHFAVSNNDPKKIQILLNMGANVNAKSHYGFTPIYHAVGKNGDLKIVNLLLMAGAKVNIKNRDGITPLHYAAWGSADKIDSLLEAGAKPNAISKSGRTPYDMALENDELTGSDTLKILKEAVTN
jgi:ankyrin repeat protein